jgi:hypothetical protein
VYKDYLTKIKLVQFKESTVPSDYKPDNRKPKFGEFIFVEYESQRHSSEEIIDIMLKKVCHSYSYQFLSAYTWNQL